MSSKPKKYITKQPARIMRSTTVSPKGGRWHAIRTTGVSTANTSEMP